MFQGTQLGYQQIFFKLASLHLRFPKLFRITKIILYGNSHYIVFNYLSADISGKLRILPLDISV